MSARQRVAVICGGLVIAIAVVVSLAVVASTFGARRWSIAGFAGAVMLTGVGIAVGRSRVLAGIATVLVPALIIVAGSYADTGPAHGKGGVTGPEFDLFLALAFATLAAVPACILCLMLAVRKLS